VPNTPQFAFRATEAIVAAIAELQVLLADRRGAAVSKAAAIGWAVERAVEDLKAGEPQVAPRAEAKSLSRQRQVAAKGGRIDREAKIIERYAADGIPRTVEEPPGETRTLQVRVQTETKEVRAYALTGD
jgi:hypothetical protein